jgi:hypothetical protein
MENQEQKELKRVQRSFSQGYKLGNLIPVNEYKLLQKQFTLKALDRDAKNYNKFRAISLGFDTALVERGLLQKEIQQPQFANGIKSILKKFTDIELKSRNLSDDVSPER